MNKAAVLFFLRYFEDWFKDQPKFKPSKQYVMKTTITITFENKEITYNESGELLSDLTRIGLFRWLEQKHSLIMLREPGTKEERKDK